jgi:heterodisulfide reductase subunit A-like polyferredoxin
VPHHDADELATRLKVSVDLDGFFLEAHVKLRPVDFSSDGVYMAGMAHYPKLVDETIVQAQAAAARAALVLSRDTMTTSAMVAQVNPELCVGCLTCVRICPYGVPKISADLTGVGGILGAAQIEAAICHGCGSCVAECPAKAIELMHYKDLQILRKLDALFVDEPMPQEVVTRDDSQAAWV